MIPGRRGCLHGCADFAPGGFERGDRIGLGGDPIGPGCAPSSSDARARRRESRPATSVCAPGVPARNCGPISNIIACAMPRAWLRPADVSSAGRRLGRIASRSAEIGFSNRRASSPPPNSAAAFRGDEREVHRFVEAARRRARGAHRADAALRGREDGRATAPKAASSPRTASCRGRGCGRLLRPGRRNHGCPGARTAA